MATTQVVGGAVTQTTAVLTNQMQVYLDKKVLSVAEQNLALAQFAMQRQIPPGNSTSIKFTRFEKLALPSVALVEGVAPTTPRGLTVTQIDCTIDQWGDFIRISEILELTASHPVVEESLYLLGLQAAELLNYQIQLVLDAGTTVQYSGSKSARTALGSNDKITTAEVVKAVKTLRNNSARTFGGYFVAVVHPSVEADLLQDSKFLDATRYGAAERVYRGEISRYFSCIFVRSEAIATYTSTVTVYPTFFIGQFSYAMTKLQALRVIHHGPGSSGALDALNQIRTLGWKMAFKCVIVNNSWLLRLESAAS